MKITTGRSSWLNRLEDLELSPDDVLKICNGKCIFVSMLNTFDLEAVLVTTVSKLYLPTTSANEGHYCLIRFYITGIAMGLAFRNFSKYQNIVDYIQKMTC